MKIFKKYFNTGNIKSSISPQLSNENIFLMKKFENARNKNLKVNLKSCDYIFQTFWSDFLHLSFLNKNKNIKNFTTDKNLNNIIDFTNWNDDSYIVFQNEKDFVSYTNEEEVKNNCIEIKEETGDKDNDIKIINSALENQNPKLTLISRIPQEFNLDIKADGDVKIINSGDTKLLSDKNINIEFYPISSLNNTDLKNIFEGKRLRTDSFFLDANNRRLNVSIRSYLEVKRIFFSIINSSFLRIKKLGVVIEGTFNLNNSDTDIRSIYGPKDLFLNFNISNSKLVIGSIQGNIKINTKNESKINIENFECDNFILNSENDLNSEIEMFINNINSKLVIKGDKIKILLYLNQEFKHQFMIRHNGEVIYNLENSNQKVKLIDVTSEIVPEVIEVTSWEYMKKRIEKKLLNKK